MRRVAREPCHGAAQITRQIETGAATTPRPKTKSGFEALAHHNGFGDQPRFRLALEFRE